MKVKVTAKPPEPVSISGDFIKLDSLLKLVNAVASGGEAKLRILGGEVTVNGEECLMRGKKLRDGDVIAIGKNKYVIKSAKPEE